MNRLLVVIILLSLTVAACEKEALHQEIALEDIPVIEAYLLAGSVPQLKIFRQLPFDEAFTESQTIQDISPVIFVEGAPYAFTLDPSGFYRPDEDFLVESGKTYRLSFTFGGREISAETVVPFPPVNYEQSGDRLDLNDFPFSSVDPITLRWDNPENDYFQVALEYAERDTTEIDLFSGRLEAGNAGPADVPQQTDSYEVRVFSVNYAGTYRAILYRVTSDYAIFSQESSGNSANLVTPFSNVENGLGIFTGIASDTLYFEVNG